MKYNEQNLPIQCMMTQGTWYNGAVENSVPVGILWHDTSAKNSTIKRYVQPSEDDPNYEYLMDLIGTNKSKNDWNHKAGSAGVNAFIGKLADGTVATVQVGDWTMAPWGCGHGSLGSCNGYFPDNLHWVGKHWIQFEMCDDGYSNKTYFNQMFEEACQLTAYLCKMFNIDPRGSVKFAGISVPTILCHYDSYHLKLGSNHSDITKWFKKFGKTMEDVRDRVAEILKEPEPIPAPIFKKGDLVKIIGQNYYSGKTIPAWVRRQNWYVYSAPVGSDRVVLNENESHTSSIMSPIHAVDLEIVRNAPEDPTIRVNDLVKIIGKTYYSGQPMPTWVLKKNWYVRSAPANSDRIVLGKSEDGKSDLNSPVNRKDLELICHND